MEELLVPGCPEAEELLVPGCPEADELLVLGCPEADELLVLGELVPPSLGVIAGPELGELAPSTEGIWWRGIE